MRFIFVTSFFNLVFIYLSLEELLIDFWELIGEHSGENMAEAIWETLMQYDIQDWVSTLMKFNIYFCGLIYE